MSGRNSYRVTPDSRSKARTCLGGVSSHCSTAWRVMPKALATTRAPPAFSIACWVEVVIPAMISTACPGKQVFLGTFRKSILRGAAKFFP